MKWGVLKKDDKSQIMKDLEYHEDFILRNKVENTGGKSKSRMSNMIEFWFLKKSLLDAGRWLEE